MLTINDGVRLYYRSGTEIRCYQQPCHGVPIYAVLALFCNTPSGYNVLTNAEVNAQLHKIFMSEVKFSSPSDFLLW